MQVRRNTIWNVAEVGMSSLMLFLLYKIIVARLGVEALGIWSLVLATTSMAGVAGLGVSNGLGRFVAQANATSTAADDHGATPADYVETALFANAAIFAVIALVAYWPARFALKAALSDGAERAALDLLPFALGSFVLMNLGTVMTAALLGLQRSDIKSFLMIAGTLLQMCVSLPLVQSQGLIGVAIGQIVQGMFVALLGWVAVSTVLAGKLKLRLPTRVSSRLLKPLLGFGVRLQAITLASFLYEPAVKYIMASAGGLAALGMFELAHRLVTQARQFLAAPSQNLLPLYVQAQARGDSIASIYDGACTIIWTVAAIGLSFLVVITPIISLVLLDHVDMMLLLFVALLSLGWFVNIAAIPAFYIGLANGQLRWNLIGSALTASLPILLGWPLGTLFGAPAIVACASVALALGAIFYFLLNTRTAAIHPLPSRRAAAAAMKKTLNRFPR